MAYDPAIAKMVLFGGVDYVSDDYFADTWTYDGTTWTLQNPTTSPPPGTGEMAYYPPSGEVLFVPPAFDSGIGSGDTWSYDGSTWTDHGPGPLTPAMGEASTAYDPATGQMVFFGASTSFASFLSSIRLGHTTATPGSSR
jgi:hypothetical protein